MRMKICNQLILNNMLQAPLSEACLKLSPVQRQRLRVRRQRPLVRARARARSRILPSTQAVHTAQLRTARVRHEPGVCHGSKRKHGANSRVSRRRAPSAARRTPRR